MFLPHRDYCEATGSAGEDLKAKTEYGVIALSVACDHGHQALVACFKSIRKMKSADPNSEAVLSVEKLIDAKLTDAVRQSLEKEE